MKATWQEKVLTLEDALDAIMKATHVSDMEVGASFSSLWTLRVWDLSVARV